ncbi:N-acetylmuramic acid 6-phosphate etherase [Serinicoccus chungangensis]|uniref:N-acetylmuramic acid 6-phosphate etherase n=1 Tax=Serinicoccus chungangensis TaxID=767452 RepID=UPI001119494B|nr:N-acetylmuramic acid 6-phosphate etherase [Serinicoccus chungangensis]
MSTTNEHDGVAVDLLAVDLGKTGARGRWRSGGEVREAAGPGVVGLAAADGVEQVVGVVRSLTGALGLDGSRVGVLAVGLVGYHAASARREALAAALLDQVADTVVLTGDVTTTFVGAVGDRPAVVVAAGTGAVALAADGAGRTAVRDGWGFLLGDDGSGYAVGRAGLRAALEHRDGRGGSAALERAATRRFGDLAGLPSAVHSAEHPSRLVASFARDVADAARAGDDAAVRIWAEAGAALARTAVAARDAVDPGLPVCLAGGLAEVGPLLTEPFAAAVGGTVLPAAGTSLDGAETLARQAWSGGPGTVLADQVTVTSRTGRVAGTLRTTPEPADDTPSGTGHAVGTLRTTPEPADDTRVEVIGALATEGVRDDLLDLDERDTGSVLRELWEAEATVAPALLQVVPTVAAAVDDIADRLRGGGRMFYLGAGTPGRLAFVDASELPPTYGTPAELVRALPAGGVEAMVQAREGAEDDGPAGAAMVREAGVGPQDVVVGISASGRTPYVLHGLAAAAEVGALTVAVSNNEGARASAGADHAIEVPTGPEVISGSTRLKAGSAQKMLLGALSTAVMVRLGKTHGPFMVDMQASNIKLRDRAVRMVQRVAGCDAAAATAALEESGWSTKVAVVQLLGGVPSDQARTALAEGDGSVRGALARAGGEPR